MAESTPQPTIPEVLQYDPLDPTLAALSTLSLLNLRLSRLEHLLTGGQNASDENDSVTDPDPSSNSKSTPKSADHPHQHDIPTQLRQLETRLTELRRKDALPGSLVRMVDILRRECPEIFASSLSTTASILSFTSTSTSPSAPTTSQLSHQASQILAHASLYTSTSSRLQTLQTLRIPAATVSTNIIEQGSGSRMRELLARQEKLEQRAEGLRVRSEQVLRWWVDVGIRGMGEIWEDWEDRIAVCERFVKIYERRASEERGEEG